MKPKYKAILNEDNICFAMHHNTPMVKGIEVNENKVGMRYIAESDEWEQAELPQEEPTEEELYQAEVLLNQIEIMALQQAQDEVLAEILLNQLGV